VKGPEDNISQKEEKVESGPKQINLLAIAFWSVVVVSLLMILLPSLIELAEGLQKHIQTPTPSPDPPPFTETITPTVTLTITPTASATRPAVTSTITPIPPKPTKPYDIRVGPWHDNSPNCDPNPGTPPHITTVSITGVELSYIGPARGGPPYEIILAQNDRTLGIINSRNDYIKFSKPVEVEKGSYIHVTIHYYRGNDVITWEGNLLYLHDEDNPECQK
jgi:hypothetical protein